MYKLLTPGPLTTSSTVKEAMLIDHCTWDNDYKQITQEIRTKLLNLAHVSAKEYTAVLMQGSGSFGVESVLSSMLRPDDHLLLCVNGAYGQRMADMCERYEVETTIYATAENQIPDAKEVERIVADHPSISAIAMVHSETTSGILNDLSGIGAFAKQHDLLFIVDAMSSFGGIDIDFVSLDIDFLISSSNKCIQGVPGFSFVIAKRKELEERNGSSKTLSLDLYEQYKVMEDHGGKWRFTSPTHTVLAFQQALKELEEEGGIQARNIRYAVNNRLLREEMATIGYEPFIKDNQGPFITSFMYPDDPTFDFNHFYHYLKQHGFVIYPGKINHHDCFRIGNIGDIYPEDILELTAVIKNYRRSTHD